MIHAAVEVGDELTAEGWGWRHAGRTEWAVRDVSFRMAPGERVLLLGASGAGKSTLVRGLAGVLGGDEDGDEQGRLLVRGTHPSRMHGHVGLVMQDPDSQVVLARVGDDVAFGCENMGVPRDEIWPRVREALDAVGLDVSLDHPTSALSGGQKQRLAIAGALAMRARVLLLDEPTANLDPQGVREVAELVTRLARERGTTIVVVEHRVELWAPLVDRVMVLGSSGLLADGAPDEVFASQRKELLAAGVWVPGAPLPEDLDAPLPPVVGAEPLLSTESLTIGHSPSHPVRTDVQVEVPSATSTMLTGPNGAGKSTLALTLAGLLPPLAGRVAVAPSLQPPVPPGRRGRRVEASNPASWPSRDLVTRIGTVFQTPEHQFVATTVREELAAGLRSLAVVDPSWTPQRIDARVGELLDLLHLGEVAGANPFTLSGGQQRRLSVATVLATGPRVIVLDEPTFGQDRNTWISMVRLVRSMVADGRAVLSVTHDADFIAALGQHHIDLAAEGVRR